MTYDGDMTPNLSGSFHPIPKPEPKIKTQQKRIKAAVRSLIWKEARPELVKIFAAHGINGCEIKLKGCLGNQDQFMGFAHVKRRKNYTPEELIDPRHNVAACEQCHNTVDFEMPKRESEALLASIVAKRGW